MGHAAVQDAHPELQHDPPELVVRVGRGARHERQVVRVVVLQAAGRQERQRVEVQVRDAEEALQEGEPAVAGAHDDDPRVHGDLRLAEELLGHDGECLGLGGVPQDVLAVQLLHVRIRGHLLLDVHEGRDLRRLPQHLLELRWPARRHLEQLPENGRDGPLEFRLHEEHRLAHQPQGSLVEPAGVLLEERVDDPVDQLSVTLVLGLLVVVDQQVVIQVVAAPQRRNDVRPRSLQDDEPDDLLVEVRHEASPPPLRVARVILVVGPVQEALDA